MDLCYQTIKRCVVAVALWLVSSSSDCEAVPNDTTRLVGWLMCCWIDGMGVCASLVRTASKSLARVLTPSALDLSLSMSLAMQAAMPFVCMTLSLCVYGRR